MTPEQTIEIISKLDRILKLVDVLGWSAIIFIFLSIGITILMAAINNR